MTPTLMPPVIEPIQEEIAGSIAFLRSASGPWSIRSARPGATRRTTDLN
jgi:hypothetical protein